MPQTVEQRRAAQKKYRESDHGRAKRKARYALVDPSVRRAYTAAYTRRVGTGGWPVPPGSVCALCGDPGGDTRYTKLVMDHCHVTGKLRDPLCTPCNTLLGRIEKDPDRVAKMVEYSKAWRAKHQDGD